MNVVTLMQVRAEWVLGDWSTCSDLACITPGRQAERSVFLACLECQMTSLRLLDIGQMDDKDVMVDVALVLALKDLLKRCLNF